MIKVEGGHLWLMMSADLSHAQWETRLCQITGTNFTMSDSFIKLQNKPVQETPNLIVLGGSLFLHHLTIQAAVCKLTQLLMQCCREHSLDNNDTIISVFTFTSIFWRTVPGNYLWWLCVVYHLCAVCLKFVFQSTTTVRSTERCEIITCPSAGHILYFPLVSFLYSQCTDHLHWVFFSSSSLLHGIQGQPHFF